jgi:regulator of sirC expression with transglutaminase-like and TPR domain
VSMPEGLAARAAFQGYNRAMDLDSALSQLALDPDAPLDLAEVSLHLAQDEYPDLDVEAYLSQLAGMAHEARPYLRGSLDARVTGLCRYLFHDLGFRGNTQSYYEPRNSYLNEVLDRRTGLPILLSTVAMAVGERAGLTVVGVGLPGHFVAKVVENGNEVLFDPFHGGRRLSPEQCEALVYQITGTTFRANRESLAAVPLALILVRMLNNLKGTYLRDEEFDRAARVIRRLRRLRPDDPLQERDLGATLLRAGKPGQAVDHLNAYLQELPHASDAETVRGLLNQALSEVAKWN